MASTFEQYVVNDDVTHLAIETDWQAQSFTIGNTGANLTFNVTSVDILSNNDSGAGADPGMTARIYNVLPDGSPDINGGVLSSGTYTEDGGSGVSTWKNVTMSTATLKASTQYSLVILETGTATVRVAGWRADQTSPTYGGGSRWFSTDTGATWTVDAGDDCLFRINGGNYAGTLCTLADARNKAGANANSSATNESLVSDYVRQAEGTMAAITRFDWVAAYPAITGDVKFILNDVASNLAAIYIITYDMAGFTDRVEAETMINVYRDAALRGLSILKNQEVRKFIVADT